MNKSAEIEKVKAAFLTFAASLDLKDLPSDEIYSVFDRLYKTDANFRDWFDNAPELQPMHKMWKNIKYWP